MLKQAAVGLNEGVPSDTLFRDGRTTPEPASGTETGSIVVFPVFKSTIMGANDTGHAKQIDGIEEPGYSRACRGVCCKVVRVIFSPLTTSHSVNDLSAADTRMQWPYFDQHTLVTAALQSSSRNSFATPLVSKSQIMQLPSEQPAVPDN